ncbi:SDR family oxidoreductase [Rhodobacter sp. SY28-1]|uniref:SDR family oxidoreductase n=1 Tax=Rhodobacter sp. SY28-1 TaxID=2562317 RepID=UPI0010BFEE06|nr:SDR family oxidoreductase [Rhodobacter sp. SY28-1]
MKVLILGGTGVFGERLARLLARDGHQITIAARGLPAAQSLAAELNATALQLDRKGDLSALHGYQVIIDAAGPFHAYGADPYRLAKAALAAGSHYLDLADNAAFCAGITALDAEARTANKAAISGLSSVPAISSAAVRALAGTDCPLHIDSAILPGNRSPRGLSVMASILAQAGRPYPLYNAGRWTTVPGWSAPQDYALLGGLSRQGWRIEVPDTRLFPAHFGAETVEFRAGLELGIMRYGLAAFATLRRVLPFPVTAPLVRAFRLAADLLAPFGTGTGGMSVTVTTATHRLRWSLLATHGDGPFVPAIAIRALLRRPDLPVGATPALETVTLDEIEAALSDLSIRCERQSETLDPIFPRVLGPAFTALPKAIRATHLTAATTRWTGRASVTRGTQAWSRLIATLFRFPAASEETEVEVTKTVTAQGETWTRRFGTRSFQSHLKATPQGMTERFGPFTFTLGLTVKDGALHYPVLAGRVGPIPLPRWALPGSDTREHAENGRFHFDVCLTAPLTGGLMVHYRGTLSPSAPEDPSPPG